MICSKPALLFSSCSGYWGWTPPLPWAASPMCCLPLRSPSLGPGTLRERKDRNPLKARNAPTLPGS
jgi:hypothetical protein